MVILNIFLFFPASVRHGCTVGAAGTLPREPFEKLSGLIDFPELRSRTGSLEKIKSQRPGIDSLRQGMRNPLNRSVN